MLVTVSIELVDQDGRSSVVGGGERRRRHMEEGSGGWVRAYGCSLVCKRSSASPVSSVSCRCHERSTTNLSRCEDGRRRDVICCVHLDKSGDGNLVILVAVDRVSESSAADMGKVSLCFWFAGFVGNSALL